MSEENTMLMPHDSLLRNIDTTFYHAAIIEKAEAAISEINQKHPANQPKPKPGVLKIIGIVIGSIIAFWLIVIASVAVVNPATSLLGPKALSLIPVLVIFAVVGVVAFALLYRRQHQQVTVPQRWANYEQATEEELVNLHNIIQSSKELLSRKSAIPQTYWTTWATYSIKTYFANGRADTLKEAINLFETEDHRRQSLKMLRIIHQEQIYQSALLDSIEARNWI